MQLHQGSTIHLTIELRARFFSVHAATGGKSYPGSALRRSLVSVRIDCIVASLTQDRLDYSSAHRCRRREIPNEVRANTSWLRGISLQRQRRHCHRCADNAISLNPRRDLTAFCCRRRNLQLASPQTHLAGRCDAEPRLQQRSSGTNLGISAFFSSGNRHLSAPSAQRFNGRMMKKWSSNRSSVV